MIKLPTFESLEEAKAYLEQRGRLDFFGRGGRQYEYCIYNYHSNDGWVYALNIYEKGKIEFRSKKEVIAMSKLSKKDMDIILKKATQTAKERAKREGAPLYYAEDEKTIKEYPDGRRVEIISELEEMEVEANG